MSRGLTLRGVEERSGGRWRAGAISSYERGDRALPVAKLAELAAFYGVPAALALPDVEACQQRSEGESLVVDLDRLFEMPEEQAGPLARYAAVAWSGNHSQAIRPETLAALAILYRMSPQELYEKLLVNGILMVRAGHIRKPDRE